MGYILDTTVVDERTGSIGLAHRARQILYSVVTEYIATGEPVSSRRLARKYGLQLSPASIRSVLADLEESGLLSQPHTSAGRVPTSAGFRVFVEALVQMREVSAEDRAAIAARLGSLSSGEGVARETGRLLATLTQGAAIVVAPRIEDQPLAQLRFVPIDSRRVLAVLVTVGGGVENRVVETQLQISPHELERVHNYLAEFAHARSLREIREQLADDLEQSRTEYNRLLLTVQTIIGATLEELSEETQVVVEGQAVLFDRPEFSNPAKIRAFIKTFEEKERLVSLLDGAIRTGGVQVLIGAEAQLEDVEDVSVITATYRQRGSSAGSLGVIGPARVDYAKLVPLVDFTAKMLSGKDYDRDGEGEDET